MENSNSREYLDKITAAVIDNLRQTGSAPSVQMQDVPRKPFGGMTDEEEAELDDLDEDENKDVRMTEHRWDKQIENGAEFEPSEDDEMASANGATRTNGKKRNFTDFKAQDEATRSTNISPQHALASNGKDETGSDVNDDTIEDIGTTEGQEKTEPVEGDKEDAAEKPQVDADGDVGMADVVASDEANIKKEEVEAVSVTKPDEDTEKTLEEKPPASKAVKDSADAGANQESVAEDTAAAKDVDKPIETEDKQPAPEAMEVDVKEKLDERADDKDVS